MFNINQYYMILDCHYITVLIENTNRDIFFLSEAHSSNQSQVFIYFCFISKFWSLLIVFIKTTSTVVGQSTVLQSKE